MPSHLPSSIDDAQAALHRLAERLELTPSPPGSSSWRGIARGLSLQTDVTVFSQLGVVQYAVKTTISLTPPLGLGLELWATRGNAKDRPADHLPPRWRNDHILRRLARRRSRDPYVTRVTLEEVPPPRFFLRSNDNQYEPTEAPFEVGRVDDTAVVLRGEMLPSIREVEEHLVEGATWAAQLVEAAQTARPTEHEAMPDALWKRVVETREGTFLDRHAWRYLQETPHGTLALALRWEADRGYALEGRIHWPPLPLEKLELKLQANRSWFKRLFLPDVKVGDDAFDEAFLVDTDASPERLAELLPPRVRQSLVALAAHTLGLAVDRTGAAFLVHPLPTRPTELEDVLDAVDAILDELRIARDPSRGAYR